MEAPNHSHDAASPQAAAFSSAPDAGAKRLSASPTAPTPAPSRGRPRKAGSERRTIQKIIRFTPSEAERLPEILKGEEFAAYVRTLFGFGDEHTKHGEQLTRIENNLVQVDDLVTRCGGSWVAPISTSLARLREALAEVTETDETAPQLQLIGRAVNRAVRHAHETRALSYQLLESLISARTAVEALQ